MGRVRPNRRTVVTLILAVAAGLSTGRAFAVDILYTGCSNGRIENCHCPNDTLGAMEKRTVQIEKRRQAGEVLLLDSGDFLPALVDTLAAQTIIGIMRLTGYDAVGIGDQELMHGPEILKTMVDSLPIVSANLVWADGTPVAPSLRLIERDGTLFAVTAIIIPDAFRFIPPEMVDHVRALDPDSALAAVVARVPEGAKVIVLSHSGEFVDRAHADRWENVDLIVGGHSQSVIETVDRRGRIPVVQAGGNGRYLGIASFDGDAVEAELMPIGISLPDDPRVIEMLMKLKSLKFRRTVHSEQ